MRLPNVVSLGALLTAARNWSMTSRAQVRWPDAEMWREGQVLEEETATVFIHGRSPGRPTTAAAAC